MGEIICKWWDWQWITFQNIWTTYTARYQKNMFSSVQFSHSVVSDFLWPHGLQHTRLSLSITNFRSLLKLVSIELVMPSNHLIICHPLLLLPSVFHSIRVFSNELVLCIRWPKCWHFSFVFQMGSVVTDTPNYLTWSWVQVSVSTVKCTWEVWCSVLVWGFWRKTLTLVYHLEA